METVGVTGVARRAEMRNVVVPGGVWAGAKARAHRRGETMGAVITAALAAYVRGPKSFWETVRLPTAMTPAAMLGAVGRVAERLAQEPGELVRTPTRRAPKVRPVVREPEPVVEDPAVEEPGDPEDASVPEDPEPEAPAAATLVDGKPVVEF